MSEKQFREKLSRLQALIAIKNAQIMADPLRHLNEMSKQCYELLGVLEKVEYSLSPDLVYDVWSENFDKDAVRRPSDIQGEALIRCNAALKVLEEYKA